MKLFLDASVSTRVGDALAALGFDVVSQRTAIPLESVDTAVLSAAWSERRIVVARDYDMAELVLRGFGSAVAVVIVAFDLADAGLEAKRIADELYRLGDKLAGSVLIIEPSRIRLRPYDIGS